MNDLERNELEQKKEINPFDEAIKLANDETDPNRLRALLKEFRLELEAERSLESATRDSVKLKSFSEAIRIIEAKLRGSKRVFKWK